MTVMGFTCGAFDLCHAGHLMLLEEAKRNCDILTVGLHSDPSRERKEKINQLKVYTKGRYVCMHVGTSTVLLCMKLKLISIHY